MRIVLTHPDLPGVEVVRRSWRVAERMARRAGRSSTPSPRQSTSPTSPSTTRTRARGWRG